MAAMFSIAYCWRRASVCLVVGPDRLGEFPQGIAPRFEHFRVPFLGFPERGVAVRSPLDVHVDNFVHIGFLDRVDDSRERLGIVAAQRDLHDLRSCDELDDQRLLEPRDRIDLLPNHRILADFVILQGGFEHHLALDECLLRALIALILFAAQLGLGGLEQNLERMCDDL